MWWKKDVRRAWAWMSLRSRIEVQDSAMWASVDARLEVDIGAIVLMEINNGV